MKADSCKQGFIITIHFSCTYSHTRTQCDRLPTILSVFLSFIIYRNSYVEKVISSLLYLSFYEKACLLNENLLVD